LDDDRPPEASDAERGADALLPAGHTLRTLHAAAAALRAGITADALAVVQQRLAALEALHGRIDAAYVQTQCVNALTLLRKEHPTDLAAAVGQLREGLAAGGGGGAAFSDGHGLALALADLLAQVAGHRGALLAELRALAARPPSPEHVRSSMQCGSCRNVPDSTVLCAYCALTDRFRAYEGLLFAPNAIALARLDRGGSGGDGGLADAAGGDLSREAQALAAGQHTYLLGGGGGAASEPARLQQMVAKIGALWKAKLIPVLGSPVECLDMVDRLRQEFSLARALWVALWQRCVDTLPAYAHCPSDRRVPLPFPVPIPLPAYQFTIESSASYPPTCGTTLLPLPFPRLLSPPRFPPPFPPSLPLPYPSHTDTAVTARPSPLPYRSVSIFDEADMCTWRLQLRPTDRAVPAAEEARYVAHIPTAVFAQRCALATADADLRITRGRLGYLTSELRCHERGEVPQCRICLEDVCVHRGLLVCGHTYCVPCLLPLLTPRPPDPTARVRCPVCRAYSASGEIEYMVVAPATPAAPATAIAMATSASSGGGGGEMAPSAAEAAVSAVDTPLAGDFPSKVQAIVRRLQHIDRAYPGEKALVFSQWEASLGLVAAACHANGVPVLMPRTAVALGPALERFRRDAGVRALLLTTARGGQGVNLVEASHVILVEPLANPGLERQAVSRVDRIGQVGCIAEDGSLARRSCLTPSLIWVPEPNCPTLLLILPLCLNQPAPLYSSSCPGACTNLPHSTPHLALVPEPTCPTLLFILPWCLHEPAPLYSSSCPCV